MTLRDSLRYEPRELRFGTSGRRGELIHLTQLEIYINAVAELRYLQSLKPEDGGITGGDDFFFAYDLRPSSTAFDEASGGKGELAQAVAQAIQDTGMRPVNLGAIPTPALTCYALSQGKGSIMVTGSHIPFDRNGYKLNTSRGELLKWHEEPIGRAVAAVRVEHYGQDAERSRFDSRGMLKGGHRDLPEPSDAGLRAYRERYVRFFYANALAGKRFLFYQHSAVARDLAPEILRALGAEIITAGRSDTFVPIDTENIDDEQLSVLQQLADSTSEKLGALDGVVSTDGDSDRPLLLGIGDNGALRFFGGDLLGMVVAEYLGADAVVVPVTCNDAIDRGPLKKFLRPKTKIGSPFVIAGMEEAAETGARIVCGWEANGGFLLGSDLKRGDRTMQKLATRDALLPLCSVLASAAERSLSLCELFDQLPKRFSKAALLKNLPRPISLAILEKFAVDGSENSIGGIQEELGKYFRSEDGFGPVTSIDYTDGLRISFSNGEIAHVRPSGNADELRIYAVADTQGRADEIVRKALAEPSGILRQLQRSVLHDGGAETANSPVARRDSVDRVPEVG